MGDRFAFPIAEERRLNPLSCQVDVFVGVVGGEQHSFAAHGTQSTAQWGLIADALGGDVDVATNDLRGQLPESAGEAGDGEAAVESPKQIGQCFAYVAQDDLSLGVAFE